MNNHGGCVYWTRLISYQPEFARPDVRFQTNRIVTALTAGFLLYTRSVGVAYFTTGALVCSLTVKVIKRCLRQPRPLQVVAGSKAKKSYGYLLRILHRSRSDAFQDAQHAFCHDRILCDVHCVGLPAVADTSLLALQCIHQSSDAPTVMHTSGCCHYFIPNMAWSPYTSASRSWKWLRCRDGNGMVFLVDRRMEFTWA